LSQSATRGAISRRYASASGRVLRWWRQWTAQASRRWCRTGGPAARAGKSIPNQNRLAAGSEKRRANPRGGSPSKYRGQSRVKSAPPSASHRQRSLRLLAPAPCSRPGPGQSPQRGRSARSRRRWRRRRIFRHLTPHMERLSPGYVTLIAVVPRRAQPQRDMLRLHRFSTTGATARLSVEVYFIPNGGAKGGQTCAASYLWR